MRAYVLRTLQPYFARVGWEPRAGEALERDAAARDADRALGELGDEAVIAEARRACGGGGTDPTLRRPASATPCSASTPATPRRRTTTRCSRARARRRTSSNSAACGTKSASARDEALARRTLQMVLGDDIPRQMRPTGAERCRRRASAPGLGLPGRQSRGDRSVARSAVAARISDDDRRQQLRSGKSPTRWSQYASNQPEGAQRTAAGSRRTSG